MDYWIRRSFSITKKFLSFPAYLNKTYTRKGTLPLCVRLPTTDILHKQSDARNRDQVSNDWKISTSFGHNSPSTSPLLSEPSSGCRSDYPIKQVPRKPELAGQMIAWSIELFEFGLRDEPRGHIKAQCLSDFAAELTGNSEPMISEIWEMYVDGSSNTKGTEKVSLMLSC